MRHHIGDFQDIRQLFNARDAAGKFISNDFAFKTERRIFWIGYLAFRLLIGDWALQAWQSG